MISSEGPLVPCTKGTGSGIDAWTLARPRTCRVTEVMDTRPDGTDLRGRRRTGRVLLDQSEGNRGEREDISLSVWERHRVTQNRGVVTVNEGHALASRAQGLHHLRYREVSIHRRRSGAIRGPDGPLIRIGGSVSNPANVGSWSDAASTRRAPACPAVVARSWADSSGLTGSGTAWWRSAPAKDSVKPGPSG